MPSTPRGRDAATLLAVILALVLAVVWLRVSDGAAPQVPVGLSVGTLPAVAPEGPAELAPRARGREGASVEGGSMVAWEERRAPGNRDRTAAGSKRRGLDRAARGSRADRAGGGEARGHRNRGARRGAHGRIRPDPSAAAPTAPAGSGAAGMSGAGAAGSGVTSGTAAPPEFALE
ncbi:MAG TPA: hypothetical protein VFS37_13570 [Conexibacter sp.]|nr:hypothetical protein [Conexibacter sp.]